MVTQLYVYRNIHVSKNIKNQLQYFEVNIKKLGGDPKAIQQNHFTGNKNRAEGTTMFLIIEEAKKNSFGFFKGNS